jgi:hypothetical protein
MSPCSRLLQYTQASTPLVEGTPADASALIACLRATPVALNALSACKPVQTTTTLMVYD